MSNSKLLTVFTASLYRINTDHEGEGRITFSVPLSDLAAATQLYLAIGKELIVRVEEKTQ